LFAEKYARCTNFIRPEGGSFWAYQQTSKPVSPLHPAFAVSWDLNSIGPGSLFQLRPPPGDCDPTRASTAHPGGMQVGMADGSVGPVSPPAWGPTWWAACPPASGDLLGPDW